MTSQLDDAGSGEYLENSNLHAYVWGLPEVQVTTQSPSRVPHSQSAEPTIRRDDAWRHERVALAAYYLAANRGFDPGHEAQDWSLAELQIDAIDAGRTVAR
jgi:hypothetical protein